MNVMVQKRTGLRKILADESRLNMMKNIFYFMLKALFIVKILNILSWLFGQVGKRLDKKAKVLWPYGQTNRSLQYACCALFQEVGNQAVKFAQLIECNVRNIFLQKSYRRWGREASFRLIFVFRKVYIRSKTQDQSKWSAPLFCGPPLGHTIKKL